MRCIAHVLPDDILESDTKSSKGRTAMYDERDPCMDLNETTKPKQNTKGKLI